MMRVKLAFFSFGLLLLTAGISLIVKGNLGAAPWDALAIGESQLFHLSIGMCIFINGCLLIIVNSILLSERIEFFAAFSIFLIGMLVNFWISYGFINISPSGLLEQFSFTMIGIIMLGVGISIYLQAHLPSSPMDTFMVALHKRFGLNLNNARLLTEAIAVTLAVIFQGAVGVGTFLVACTLGFVIHFFYPIMEKIYDRWTFN
jgi:uncharacterized protein